MDTAWIPIFVLSFAECVAPAGKTVCQEHEFELQFLTQADCEAALEQLIDVKDASETIIVDKKKSRCAPSARQHAVYANLADVSAAVADEEAWIAPDAQAPVTDSMKKAHQERLASLPSCEDSKGVAPCKIGEIIIEEAEAPKQVEVWQREN